MFSISQRFQHLSSVALSCAFVAIAFIATTSWLQLFNNQAFQIKSNIENIKPRINLVSSRKYGASSKNQKESVRALFDLEADLSPLFNYNTKQVFVYLTAEYNGTKNANSNSKVTFWDSILTDESMAKLSLSGEKSKYNVWDLESKLSDKDLIWKLNWNVQPYVGLLINGETTGSTLVQFEYQEPSQKEKKRAPRNLKEGSKKRTQ